VFTGELVWPAGGAGDYFAEEVTRVAHAPDGGLKPGAFNWPVVAGLALTWFVVWWCIARGVHRVGKIVMITVPLPLVLLVILTIRGLSLDGAIDGLAYYLTPNWSKLLDSQTWIAAYGQVFFSLSVGWGILIAYSSYRAKDSDVVNNAFITSYANCGFSLLAGFAVFSTLGYLALALNQPIADLKTSSFGLAFTSYPTAIENFPGGIRTQALLGFGFFIMLLTLGIDSAFSIIEAVATAAYDKFRIHKGKLSIILCVAGFLLGLIFAFDQGLNWLDINDRFLAEYSLPLVALVQTVVLGWLIGSKKFQALQDDVNNRSEIKAGWAWKWSIKVITPGVLLISLVLVFKELFLNGYGGFDTLPLLLAGAIPAGLLILGSFVLMAMKGADDADAE
jgi:NSS family neurotransmitter:Na+ symporter